MLNMFTMAFEIFYRWMISVFYTNNLKKNDFVNSDIKKIAKGMGYLYENP